MHESPAKFQRLSLSPVPSRPVEAVSPKLQVPNHSYRGKGGMVLTRDKGSAVRTTHTAIINWAIISLLLPKTAARRNAA